MPGHFAVIGPSRLLPTDSRRRNAPGVQFQAGFDGRRPTRRIRAATSASERVIAPPLPRVSDAMTLSPVARRRLAFFPQLRRCVRRRQRLTSEPNRRWQRLQPSRKLQTEKSASAPTPAK